ncbi:MAG TPA: oligosaccharide flippase family protein [Anaeromyxobacter sp.]
MISAPEAVAAAPTRPAPNLVLNIIANFLGRGWSTAVSLIFIPIYIRFLGVDAYGLIGVYMSLVALLGVLDMGLSSTLSRQLARLSATPSAQQEARDLVRTMEFIYWGVGLAIGLGIVAVSPLIARYWVHSERIPPETVRHAVMIMGCVAAFDWPAALYSGGLMGLQRQVLLNGVRGGMGTLQAVGAVVVLWLVSPTILAYFIWQGAIMALQAAVLARCLWRSLPRTGKPAAFDRALLRKNSQFAAGMTGIAFLSTILTHLDKVILSKFLTLESFGYYTLAFNLANAIGMLVQPIFLAVFPRFSQVALDRDDSMAGSLYHKTCRLLSVVVLPVAITIVFFSREALLLWIRNPETADRTHVLLSVLMVGSAFNAVAMMPFMLQLAYGWTRLSVVKNIIAASVSVPLLVWMIVHHGAMGAAIVWIAINAGYFVFEVPYMHRRLLPREMRRWYLSDNVLPVALVTAACAVSRHLAPSGASGLVTFSWIAGTWAVSAAAAAAVVGLLSPANIRTYVRTLRTP